MLILSVKTIFPIEHEIVWKEVSLMLFAVVAEPFAPKKTNSFPPLVFWIVQPFLELFADNTLANDPFGAVPLNDVEVNPCGLV